MSISYNHTVLAGYVVGPPELKKTDKGTSIAKYSIGINRGEESQFFEIVAWDKQAHLVEKYLKKSDPVLVAGRLTQESWTDKKSGEKRTRIRVTQEQIQFLGGKTHDTEPEDIT